MCVCVCVLLLWIVCGLCEYSGNGFQLEHDLELQCEALMATKESFKWGFFPVKESGEELRAIGDDD